MKSCPQYAFLLLLCLSLGGQPASAFTSQQATRIAPLRQQQSVLGFVATSNQLCRRRRSPAHHLDASSRISQPSSPSRIPSNVQDRWRSLVSGCPSPNTPPPAVPAQRPDWARDWMPTWLLNLRPSVQLATVLILYIFHLVVLTQRSIPFPVQLIPNERGHFQSIGFDS
jgi:hypothetical protein